jgi:hypothetical protein
MFMNISVSYADPRPPIAPWDAPTVEQFLSACAINNMLCDDEVRRALLDKLDMKKDTPQVCITEAHFQTSVIGWLKHHPEMHQMETEEGIYTAYKSLYPCH